MNIVPVIVAIGYKRIESMRRLLNALECAYYDENVTLIISIDFGENEEVIRLANEFKWSHGEKKVRTFTQNQGLRKHFMLCADYSLEYGAAIIFEDDVMPAPYFYNYVKRAMDYYYTDDRIFALSLYSQTWNGYANREFYPLKNGYDVYISQIECSWGECFLGKQWKIFKEWYTEKENDLRPIQNVPEVIFGWKESYSKYLLCYIVEKEKYYVTPYDSYATNFNHAGTHIQEGTSTYQVSLMCGKKEYTFPDFESAVKYDAFFESIGLKEIIEKRWNKRVCIDYYGLHNTYKEHDICFSSSLLPYKVIESYGLEMKPPELNYIYNIVGNDLYLYDLSENVKRKKDRRHHYHLIRYDVKELHWIDACFYTIYEWYKKIRKKFKEEVKR